jgi:hypothetical protein
MPRRIPRRIAATTTLPPHAAFADDELLASFERAYGIRSYNALETMAIVGTGENGLHDLEVSGELLPHKNSAKKGAERRYPGPVIARYMWRKQMASASPPEKPDKPERPTTSPWSAASGGFAFGA